MNITTIKTAKIGTPYRNKGLSIFPLSLPLDCTNGVTLADDSLQVSELTTASVPQLLVHNPKGHPVLIPAGRVLEGGRQTRTVNVSIIVPAGATMEIPVSCVEAGRWSGGHAFRNSGRYLSRRARVAKERGVKRNIDNFGSKMSDQGAVWNHIEMELSSRHLSSDSSLFLEADRSIDDNAELYAMVQELIANGVGPDQTGIAVAYGDKVVGVELFTSVDDLATSWEALVRSAVLDSDQGIADVEAQATVADVEAFLARVADKEVTSTAGTGLGTEFHVADNELVAHAIVDESGNLLHAYAFIGD